MLDWLNGLTEDFQMRSIYLVCAVIGGSIMSLQLILLMFGGDVDADTDVDHIDHGGDGFGFISIRSVAGFLTFFGLTGMYGQAEHWAAGMTVGVAFLIGLVMMFAVALLMSLQKKMYSEGNVDPQNAVGQAAKVYLRIPGERQGKGKITVIVQGRSLEFEATTPGPEIPTGAEVRVLRMTTAGAFEVERL